MQGRRRIGCGIALVLCTGALLVFRWIQSSGTDLAQNQSVARPSPRAVVRKPPEVSPVVSAKQDMETSESAPLETHSATLSPLPLSPPMAVNESEDSARMTWEQMVVRARETLVTRLAASPVQMQMFDQIVTNMNQQLGDKLREWGDYLKQQSNPPKEAGLRLANDITSGITAAYEEMDRVFPPDWRERVGEEFQMEGFLNPDVFRPLFQGKSMVAIGGVEMEMKEKLQ